ncbi:CNT_collapsed_G0015150.mRNA.1.CDS.1 [Saccharomyces cerevisiae]|nr:CNT_collapsed_G0015150.mRNA.1.CDS.1 [Saccharomyces cerevisiae]
MLWVLRFLLCIFRLTLAFHQFQESLSASALFNSKDTSWWAYGIESSSSEFDDEGCSREDSVDDEVLPS